MAGRITRFMVPGFCCQICVSVSQEATRISGRRRKMQRAAVGRCEHRYGRCGTAAGPSSVSALSSACGDGCRMSLTFWLESNSKTSGSA